LSKVPSLGYREIVSALERAGFVVVRQRGSHLRLHKRQSDRLIKLTVPAHRPVKRSTLAHILKDARPRSRSSCRFCDP
jgi:predicted RNA binding protein YcfA (HicA-like mRNA interferase family)